MFSVSFPRLVVVVSVATGASTVVLSMALNVLAFSSRSPGLFATLVGLLLPLWVLALTLAGKWGFDRPERRAIGVAAYALAAFLLVVSLPHLAEGFDRITGGNRIESWALAIVTDLTQVVVKLVVIRIAKEAANEEPAGRPAARRKARKEG